MKPVNREHLPAFFKGWPDVDLRNTALAFRSIAAETHLARIELIDEMHRLQKELAQNSSKLEIYRRYLGAELKRRREGRSVAPQSMLVDYQARVADHTKLHYSLLDQVWAAQQRHQFFAATYCDSLTNIARNDTFTWVQPA